MKARWKSGRKLPKPKLLLPQERAEFLDLFYSYMDKNDYENADKVLKEVEDIVGTTDPDIAAARTSLELEILLGE